VGTLDEGEIQKRVEIRRMNGVPASQKKRRRPLIRRKPLWSIQIEGNVKRLGPLAEPLGTLSVESHEEDEKICEKVEPGDRCGEDHMVNSELVLGAACGRVPSRKGADGHKRSTALTMHRSYPIKGRKDAERDIFKKGELGQPTASATYARLQARKT